VTTEDSAETVAFEVRAAMEVDETRMGDVWRGTQSGKSPDEIAAELGTQTSSFVGKYLRFARAIETGDLPSAPTMVRECGTATAGFLSRHRHRLSSTAQRVLQERADALRDAAIRVVESGAGDLEDAEVQDKTNQVERTGIPGIYVYTLPHYFRNPVVPSPVDSAASRTLMKVGMSGSDVIRRFNEQRRTTALPEDPWLLRIYSGEGDMLETEQSIFNLLRAADHRPAVGRAAGTEWFLTSLKFLDAIASTFSLTLRFSIEEAVDEK
jgi:hypothetical protein